MAVDASGSQKFGSPSPTFTYAPPTGVSLTGNLSCATVDGGVAINSSLPVGNYTIDGTSCSGLNAPPGYFVSYVGVNDGFVVGPAALTASLSFTGALGYTNTGTITTGSLKVSPATGAITSVTGTVAIPGISGGSATINVDIFRVFGTYIGVVHVSDPSAGLATTALVLGTNLSRTANGEVSGTASGVYGGRPYTLNFTV